MRMGMHMIKRSMKFNRHVDDKSAGAIQADLIDFVTSNLTNANNVQ